jgi:hypothetical protein
MVVALAIPAVWGQDANRATTALPAPAHEGLFDKALDLVSPAKPTPLTQEERFRLYVSSTIGPLAILSEAASAGVGQWEDSPHEWRQGASGYGKRFANDMAYNAVRQTVTYGLSELLHEDNRYFASNRRTIKGRIVYALLSPAMARRADGRRTVSVSGLVGLAGAASVSLAWAPPSWQGADNAAINFGLSYAGTAGLNLAREFVPGIVRHFRR